MSNLSLRSLLTIDAVTCLTMGILLLLASGLIAGATAIPAPWLLYAGALLLPIGALMAGVARQQKPATWAAGVIVYGNIGWVIASIGFPLAGIFTPNLFGWMFIMGQSAVVAVLAHFEIRACNNLEVYA
jgi:hypothetical protein